MHWREIYKSRLTSAAAAIAATVRSGMRVFMMGNCSVPQALLQALSAYAPHVQDVELAQTLTVGPAPWTAPELDGHVRSNVLFIGGNVRPAIWEGRADFTPVLLSEVTTLFRRALPLDVALIQVSPPDEQGFCSLGIDSGLTKTPTEAAKVIVAQINPHMPRIHGDTLLYVERLDHIVEVDTPLYEYRMGDGAADPTVQAIAQHIAGLIPDGATLQLGIGEIPDAVLPYLEQHKDLGIHSELFSDGVMRLVEQGVITGKRKTLHPGKLTAGFLLGSRDLYRWADNNPLIELRRTEYVNDPCIIGRNYRQIAINSAIEVDLTGQVCADSLGTRPFSGAGGQADFIYGAARSTEGVPIIALPSTAKGGAVSRITPTLKPGAGVVTTRNHVHWVTTEFGAVNLYGKSLRLRAQALISIAHPDFREQLTQQARELGYL